MEILKKIGRLRLKSKFPARSDGGSIKVLDRDILDKFSRNLDNTFLVSFPRTGSHWLRMLMELYFGRPSLVRVFYYTDRKNYLTLHTHDLDLSVQRKRVIYIFRDPVDTVFSQLSYHEEALEDTDRVIFWADLYGKHLSKWLHEEQFTSLKTILNYEDMRRNISSEFVKVTRHFNCEFDENRFHEVSYRITKEEVKRKTPDDPQVVQLAEAYEERRRLFKKEKGDLVWSALCQGRQYLLNNFHYRLF